MKKLFASLVALSLLLVGCGSGSDDDSSSTDGFEVALITDSGSVTDKSFNQSAYEAIEAYCGEDITYKYYAPQSTDDDGLYATIEQAIDNGAKIIVTPGFNFTTAVTQAEADFPDTTFVAIDQTDLEPTSNTISYIFAENESGYLVGYAAVKEGYTKLGFMGGMAGDSVVNYGVGFLQGANDAAEELGVEVSVNYYYTGTYSADPSIKTACDNWYVNDGVEIVFSCGGQICSNVFASAEENSAMSIGVDVDQGDESTTVLTSALKGVGAAVTEALEAFYNDSFEGGKVVTLTGSGDMVYNADKFTTFTQEDYEAILAKIQNSEIDLYSCDDITENSSDPSTYIDLSNVTVNYQS
ncbi:MAG: BMP family ABC transporter substrate-binding protein [Erysipelotrichaceae bacterium]|nr:BMP family ABC transporter substrate-binding protein [Erysipelotrichaceae bacterium]